MRRAIAVAAWVAVLLIGQPVPAPADPPGPFPSESDIAGEGEPELPEAPEPAGDDVLDEGPGFIDSAHHHVSAAILSSARWIDSFFADERIEHEESETRIRLGIGTFTEEGNLFAPEVGSSVRLDLPLASQRLHLLFIGDDEEEEALAAERRSRTIPALRDRSPSLSVRYFLISSLRRNVSLNAGLRFQHGTPALRLEPRYRQNVPLNDWNLRFTQRFALLSTGDMEFRTSFDLERPLGKLFFRSTADGAWFEAKDGYFYGLRFALYQPISPDRAIQYLWVNQFVTEPTHALDEVRLLFSYRQRFWREWLFFEVSPQISFPRKRNYEISPGLLLRIEIVFGDCDSIGGLF